MRVSKVFSDRTSVACVHGGKVPARQAVYRVLDIAAARTGA